MELQHMYTQHYKKVKKKKKTQGFMVILTLKKYGKFYVQTSCAHLSFVLVCVSFIHVELQLTYACPILSESEKKNISKK